MSFSTAYYIDPDKTKELAYNAGESALDAAKIVAKAGGRSVGEVLGAGLEGINESGFGVPMAIGALLYVVTRTGLPYFGGKRKRRRIK